MICSAVGCDRKPWAKGLCNSHYARVFRGGPIGGPIKQNWEKLADMLATRSRTAECWDDAPWDAVTRPGAYPALWYKGVYLTVGALVLELDGNEPKPEGHEVLHSCDNKACFNPLHLRWGTRSENVVEAIERGLRPQNRSK